MAYQTADIVSRVQKRIKDTSYPASDVRGFLTDTLNDVYNSYSLRFMQTFQNYTVTIGNSDITNGDGLPDNYVQAIKLINTTNGNEDDIPYIEEEELDNHYPDHGDTVLHANGQPEYWYFDGETIRLFPAPADAYTLKLRYHKRPTALTTDNQVPELPSEFEELLIRGACSRILEEKENYDQAAIHENHYLEQVQKLVTRYSRPQSGQVQRIPINRSRYVMPSSRRWR